MLSTVLLHRGCRAKFRFGGHGSIEKRLKSESLNKGPKDRLVSSRFCNTVAFETFAFALEQRWISVESARILDYN